MLIEEISQLNEWIESIEKKYGVINKLTQLVTVLDANLNAMTSRNGSQQMQTFSEQKQSAIAAIRAIDISQLSNDQIECLRVHNAVDYFGTESANRITEIFRNDGHDLAYLAGEMRKILNAIVSAKKGILAVSKSLSPYVEAVTSIDYLKDSSRFSIIFREGVKVNNLKDLESRAKEWSIVMHGIGVALNIPPTDFKVLGARNGSFVIDIHLAAAAIIPIGFILNRSFNILEQFALSMRRIKEVFSLDLNDPNFIEIQKDIKSASDKYFSISKKVAAKDISKKVLDDIECPKERRSEADIHLQKSIKKILDHLRKGGDLDAYIPDLEINDDSDNNDIDKNRNLLNLKINEAKELISEFRHKKIEHTSDIINLLEYFNFDDEETE